MTTKKLARPRQEVAHKTTKGELTGYVQFLEDVKARVRSAQLKAAVSVNKELIKLYWEIGKQIVLRQKNEGWGSQVIERLAKDLNTAFPGLQGFSRPNIFKMRAFYLAYEKVSQAVRQIDDLPFFRIPWGHNVILVTRIKDDQQRLWYAEKTIENGWSRSVLDIWIDSDLYNRQGKAINNFQETLPRPQSDLANQTLKDPYCFDFLTLAGDALEKDIEDGLVGHVQKFLLELGQGFALVGRQVPLEVDGDTHYVDLLFYHYKLRCFVVIELKATEFKPEHAGQINFYLSAVDDMMRHPDDKPTIGILLCKTKKSLKVEYALRGIKKPIGVESFETKIVASLPKEYRGTLQTIQELEDELKGKSNATSQPMA